MAKRLIVVKREPLGWVVFSRPQVKNAFDLEMWKEVPRTVPRWLKTLR